MVLKRFIFSLFLSSCLIIHTVPARAFVGTALEIAGYIILANRSAILLGGAIAAGAVGTALLINSNDTPKAGRVALPGTTLAPRVPFSSSAGSSDIYGPPPEYPEGCNLVLTDSTGSSYLNNDFGCSQAWSIGMNWINSHPQLSGKSIRVSRVCSGCEVHVYSESRCDSSYSTDNGNCYSAGDYSSAPSDNFSDLQYNPLLKQFSTVNNDPDYQSTIDGTEPQPQVQTGTIGTTTYGSDGNGNARTIQTVVDPDTGDYKVIQTTDNPDGSTSSQITSTFDGTTGSFKSTSTQTQTGRVSIPTTDTVSTEPTTQTQPTDPVPQTQTYPTDYARQGEAGAAADRVVTELQDIKADMDKAPILPSEPVPPAMPWFGDTFDSLLSWTLPAHSSTCPTWDFSVFGTDFSMNQHCQIIEEYRQDFSAASVLVFLLIALFIVLGA